jgi:hypothetical protein
MCKEIKLKTTNRSDGFKVLIALYRSEKHEKLPYKHKVFLQPKNNNKNSKCLTFLFYNSYTYIHTTHALFLKGQQKHLRYFSEMPTFYQNYLVMRT